MAAFIVKTYVFIITYFVLLRLYLKSIGHWLLLKLFFFFVTFFFYYKESYKLISLVKSRYFLFDNRVFVKLWASDDTNQTICELKSLVIFIKLWKVIKYHTLINRTINKSYINENIFSS